jgi:hypothetical protein
MYLYIYADMIVIIMNGRVIEMCVLHSTKCLYLGDVITITHVFRLGDELYIRRSEIHMNFNEV